MLAKVFVGLLLALSCVFAALPPGYEDELYCPPGSCLRKKNLPQGYTGSKVALHECVDETSGKWVSSPRPWGSEIDVAIRNEFLADKYHTAVCTASVPPTVKEL